MKKFFVLIMFLVLTVKGAESLPERYDLRDYGRITSVKNQEKLAVCGTFASLGAMESNYLTQGLGKAPDLSEMHLVYYGYGHSGTMPEKSFNPTYSGETFAAVAFCARLAGPALEQNMKYSDKLKSVGRSAAKMLPEDYKRPMRLREAYFLSSYDPYDAIDIDTRKKLIMEHGAIVIGYYSDIKKYHRAKNYYTYFNNSQRRTHEVLLAGWDDNFSRDNFNPKPKNNGAWLVKNSWGTDWGGKGTIPVEAKRKRHSENAVAHKGESYFSENGTSWEDGITIIGGSNACIKAFTITK